MREHNYWSVTFSTMTDQKQLQNVKHLGSMITNDARFRCDNEATRCTTITHNYA